MRKFLRHDVLNYCVIYFSDKSTVISPCSILCSGNSVLSDCINPARSAELNSPLTFSVFNRVSPNVIGRTW